MLEEDLATGASERVVTFLCDGIRMVLVELADALGVA